MLLKEYCRSVEKCTLQDLRNYQQSLTGELYPWYPLEAGYSEMIRIDKDTFVARRFVKFDTDGTDEAIDRFVIRDYLPLKAITTYSSFPHCGPAWNTYLLESFCFRISERFNLGLLSFNSRNAGAVIRKASGLTYHEVMADAVALSSIPLELSAISDYLRSAGYIGRRSEKTAAEILELSKSIRLSRN